MGKKSWLYSVTKVFKPKKSPLLSDQRWEREEEVKETAAADVVSVEHFPAETSPEATNPGGGGGWGEEDNDDDEEGEDLERDRAIAAATKAAAEAADAVARLVRLAGRNRPSREERAAVVIQAFYRGYLARRALRALRALVRLQALVRGHRVRKQAYMTLRCMQSLIRAQARVRARRLQLTSHQNLLFSPSPSPGAAAAYHDPCLFLHPTRGRNHQDFSIAEEDDTCDEVNHLIHTKIPKSMRKCSPAYANPCHQQQQRWSLTEHEKPDWLDLWMTARHSTTLPHRLSSYATASSLADVDGWSEKTVEMDPGTRRSPSHIPGYMAATQSARAKARLQSPAAQQPFLVKCNSCHRRAMSVSAADASSSGGGKSSAMMNQITWSPGRVGIGLHNPRRQAGYSPDWCGGGGRD